MLSKTESDIYLDKQKYENLINDLHIKLLDLLDKKPFNAKLYNQIMRERVNAKAVLEYIETLLCK